MYPKLYQDFQLTTDNCHEEPINRPIAIQSHGYMMVFDQSNVDRLYAMSENVPTLLGLEEAVLWEQPVDKWMPKSILKAYREMGDALSWDSIDPIPFTQNGNKMSIIRHMRNEHRFIEIEPHAAGNETSSSIFKIIKQVTEPLYRCQNTDDLFDQVTKQLKKVTGYDRVMVYRFDHQNNGEVVGEAKEDHLESYYGLHYPSTDIPKISRDLFLINKSRLIPDIASSNCWMKYNPVSGQPVTYIDMSYSQLRATSPIHIEYLKNMGVAGTFTLSVIVDNKLWGLFACHSYIAHFISYELRRTCELVANIFSQRLLELLNRNQKENEDLLVDKEQEFLNRIDTESDINIQLLDLKLDIRELCNAQGMAFFSKRIGSYGFGLCPTAKELGELAHWIMEKDNSDVFLSTDLKNDLPDTFGFADNIGGMISLNISTSDENFLFWFRPPKEQITFWAGDPDKPVLINKGEGQEKARIGPRKSFEKWKVLHRSKSDPWHEHEISIVKRIRENLLKKEFKRGAIKVEQTRKEFEQLTYIASHDLQEPLRTMTNYLELLKEEVGDMNNEDISFYTIRSTNAAARMKTLIKDMLDYSRIGKETAKQWVDINLVIDDVIQDLDKPIKQKEAVVEYKSLPQIKGSQSEIRQLFQNLISNAIKYVPSEKPPFVTIDILYQAPYWIFRVKDNGIGMEEKYFERVFMMFHRLHRSDEYEGTGIGLAHCKKIVNAYDGRIWIESKLGNGTTVNIRIHELYIKYKDDAGKA